MGRAGRFLRLSWTRRRDAFPDSLKGSLSFDWVLITDDADGHMASYVAEFLRSSPGHHRDQLHLHFRSRGI